MNADRILDLIEHWLGRFHAIVEATAPAELALAIFLPLLALLIGRRLRRRILAYPNRTLPDNILDVISPLFAPVLAILFTTLAAVAFVQLALKPMLLPLVVKLCVAWLAIHVVAILSSGRSASMFIALVIIPITLLHLFGIWDDTVTFLDQASFTVSGITFNLYLMLKSIVVLIVLLWLVNLILDVTDNRLKRMRNLRASNRTLILKFSQIGLYIVVFLMALQMVGVSLTTLSIFSGAIGVGIGFGLQKIASNFISGIILLFEKSIEVGDIIELSPGVIATVERTGGRYTQVSTGDGKDVLIPNEEFITQRVTSLTHSNKRGRVDIAVGVGYEDDVALALKLLREAAGSTPRCIKDPAPYSYIGAFGDSSVSLQLFFWVDDVIVGRLEPRTQAMLKILELFRANGISIPYPHQVQVENPQLERRLRALEAGLAKPKPAKKPS